VTLLQEDAADLTLPEHSVDAIFSRFGTMFFADPIMAFANMHRMLRRRGRIVFVCWRSLNENELDFFPVEAAGLNGSDRCYAVQLRECRDGRSRPSFGRLRPYRDSGTRRSGFER
jgi:SAM-dependent methyltransferase